MSSDGADRGNGETAAESLAYEIFDKAPRGAVTLINGRALARVGGWAGLGPAVSRIAAERDLNARVFDMGEDDAAIPDEVTTHLGGDGMCFHMDWRRDLEVAPYPPAVPDYTAASSP